AHGNRNKLEAGAEFLQEGQLNFERMLALVSSGVLGEQVAVLDQQAGEFAVHWCAAERRLPLAGGQNGKRLSAAGVVGTQNDAAVRRLQARVDRARHQAGVHVAGMRDDTADRVGDLFGASGTEAALELAVKAGGTRGVELVCPDGATQHKTPLTNRN